VPVMVGVNVPTFKALDILSLQGEWWGNQYGNDMTGVVLNGVPLPFSYGTTTVVDSNIYKNNHIKWSVYGQKTFLSHFRITGQVANDHMRTFAVNYQQQSWAECLRQLSDWYYVVKVGVLF
jgi:hypothetical protein